MVFTPKKRGEHAQCWHQENVQSASTGDSGTTPSSGAAADIASGPLNVMLHSPTDKMSLSP
jgi:hypothetical protein